MGAAGEPHTGRVGAEDGRLWRIGREGFPEEVGLGLWVGKGDWEGRLVLVGLVAVEASLGVALGGMCNITPHITGTARENVVDVVINFFIVVRHSVTSCGAMAALQ